MVLRSDANFVASSNLIPDVHLRCWIIANAYGREAWSPVVGLREINYFRCDFSLDFSSKTSPIQECGPAWKGMSAFFFGCHRTHHIKW
jgi:hypothetical protein